MASDLVVESTETLEAKLEKLGPEPEAETAARQRVKEGGTPDEWIVLLSRVRCTTSPSSRAGVTSYSAMSRKSRVGDSQEIPIVDFRRILQCATTCHKSLRYRPGRRPVVTLESGQRGTKERGAKEPKVCLGPAIQYGGVASRRWAGVSVYVLLKFNY